MRVAVLSLATLALTTFLCPAQKKEKPPDVEVVAVTCRRNGDVLEFDGKLKNVGARPIRKLTIAFHLMAPGKQVVSTRRSPIDVDVLAPEDEAEFSFQAKAPARVVEFKVECEDTNGRNVSLDKSGPFPIE